jgi:hypothetical protein
MQPGLDQAKPFRVGGQQIAADQPQRDLRGRTVEGGPQRDATLVGYRNQSWQRIAAFCVIDFNDIRSVDPGMARAQTVGRSSADDGGTDGVHRRRRSVCTLRRCGGFRFWPARRCL